MSVFYSQRDPRWASQLLGFDTGSPWTIGNEGCVVTAVGNMAIATTGDENFTPESINNWGKINGGFVANGGIWIWSATPRLGTVTSQGIATSIKALNNFLAAEPNFAIIGVNNGGHYVLGTAVNTIIDSEDGLQKPLSTYSGFVSAHLYTAVNMPAPAPIGPLVTAINDTATVTVPLLNTRVWSEGSLNGPSTSDPLGPILHAGSVHVNAWVVGQEVTVAGRTDGIWLLTDGGHWFCQAGSSLHE